MDTSEAVLDEPETEARPARPAVCDDDLPRASVVVPVLDAAEDIDRLLDSLEALDYPRDRLDLVVVDNGSRDGTMERLARRSSIRLLRETRIKSSYAARNRGVEAATGEWIAFTDADCVATADWLRRLLAPGIPGNTGAVAGEVLGLETARPVQRLTERYGIMRHAVTMPHKALPGFSTANVAVRGDLLRALGGFREDVRFFADMELAWRMQIAAGARLLFRPEAVVRHRHRRTWRALWRHGRQHGQGVAFMKQVFPDRYKIRFGEQLGRIAQIVRAPFSRPSVEHSLEVPGAPPSSLATRTAPAAARDRLYAPLFLTVWYGGMAAGYLAGPAWSEPRSAGRTGSSGTPA